jgi:hypothetical protein
MSDLTPRRLTPRLVRNWKKELEPRLMSLLFGPVTTDQAQEIKDSLSLLGLPEGWKFGRRYFNKKRGWIFVLNGKESRDVGPQPEAE